MSAVDPNGDKTFDKTEARNLAKDIIKIAREIDPKVAEAMDRASITPTEKKKIINDWLKENHKDKAEGKNNGFNVPDSSIREFVNALTEGHVHPDTKKRSLPQGELPPAQPVLVTPPRAAVGTGLE